MSSHSISSIISNHFLKNLWEENWKLEKEINTSIFISILTSLAAELNDIELLNYFLPPPKGQGYRLRYGFDYNLSEIIFPEKLNNVTKQYPTNISFKELILSICNRNGCAILPTFSSGIHCKTSVSQTISTFLQKSLIKSNIYSIAQQNSNGLTTSILKTLQELSYSADSKHITYCSLKSAHNWFEALQLIKLQFGFQGSNISQLNHEFKLFYTLKPDFKMKIAVFDHLNANVYQFLLNYFQIQLNHSIILIPNTSSICAPARNIFYSINTLEMTSKINSENHLQLENLSQNDSYLFIEYFYDSINNNNNQSSKNLYYNEETFHNISVFSANNINNLKLFCNYFILFQNNAITCELSIADVCQSIFETEELLLLMNIYPIIKIVSFNKQSLTFNLKQLLLISNNNSNFENFISKGIFIANSLEKTHEKCNESIIEMKYLAEITNLIEKLVIKSDLSVNLMDLFINYLLKVLNNFINFKNNYNFIEFKILLSFLLFDESSVNEGSLHFICLFVYLSVCFYHSYY